MTYNMNEKLSPIAVLCSAFAISSVGGLAALLRSKQQLTLRSILATSLYSGTLGLVIALVWYNHYATSNVWFLLGVSGLAGIGGTTVMDFVVQVLKHGGVNITIASKQPKKPDQDGG